jgi:hypothetical protein
MATPNERLSKACEAKNFEDVKSAIADGADNFDNALHTMSGALSERKTLCVNSRRIAFEIVKYIEPFVKNLCQGLAYACASGSMVMVKHFVLNGKDRGISSANGNLIQYAKRCDLSFWVFLKDNGMLEKMKRSDIIELLDNASERGFVDRVKFFVSLLEKPCAEDLNNALCLAAEENNWNVCRYLVKKGADITKTKRGNIYDSDDSNGNDSNGDDSNGDDSNNSPQGSNYYIVHLAIQEGQKAFLYSLNIFTADVIERVFNDEAFYTKTFGPRLKYEIKKPPFYYP